MSELAQGKELLEKFKNFFSPDIYTALEEEKALLLIAANQINLERIKEEKSCYTFSYLLNEFGYECLSKKYLTFDAFLAVPAHERYTLHYLFKDGLKFLEKGLVDFKKFLSIPEKKRLSYIENLKNE